MDHPHLIRQLDRIDDPERIAFEREYDLKDAGTQSLERLHEIGFASFSRDRYGREANRLSPVGKASEILQRGFTHETGRV